jgi:uncharacterized membrane protein YphA (DoxX/SURF4 family)
MENSEVLSFGAVYLRWVLAFVFLFAGKAKSQDITEFIGTIALLRFLPMHLNSLLAHLIIIIEFSIGICLLLGFFTQVSLIMAVFIFILFTVYILVNWIRGNIFDCNCFGPYFRDKIGGKAVLRNTILIIICLGALKFYDGYLSIDSLWPHRAVNRVYPFEHFLIFTVTVTGILISALFVREIVRNFIQLEAK